MFYLPYQPQPSLVQNRCSLSFRFWALTAPLSCRLIFPYSLIYIYISFSDRRHSPTMWIRSSHALPKSHFSMSSSSSSSLFTSPESVPAFVEVKIPVLNLALNCVPASSDPCSYPFEISHPLKGGRRKIWKVATGRDLVLGSAFESSCGGNYTLSIA